MHAVLVKPLKTVFLWSLLLLLAACNTASTTPKINNEDIHYVASVAIDGSTSQAELEATYGGQAFVFKPEAGFAVLGFTKEEGELTTLSTSTNQDTFESPAFSAQSFNGSGHSAWAGGFSAWAGGFSAWAGGWSAWAGGQSIPEAPSENQAVWDQIGLNNAHQISHHFGEGVTVAVLDTGLDLNHPALSNNLVDSSLWKDYVDNDSLPQEVAGQSYGHGTGVASIILQVAPKASILPIRVLNGDGSGDLDDVISALIYAADEGADIINLSLGATHLDWSLALALEYVSNLGVYVIASSGNDGIENSDTYPGKMSNWGMFSGKVIGIGSVDNNDVLSDFSSYSWDMFGVAPGEQVFGAYPDQRTASFTGTSFAAPLYAGALALAWQEVTNVSDLNQLRYLLMNSLDQQNVYAINEQVHGHHVLGYGRLDIEQFLMSLPNFHSAINF